MQPEEAILQKTFSRLSNDFGKNHARIYWTLINNIGKPARQIKKETKIAPNIVYHILKQLVNHRFISHTNTYPKMYYCRPTLETFDEFAKQYFTDTKNELSGIRAELKKIIQNATAQSGEKYLIEINGGQTTLHNAITKEPLEYKHEIDQIKTKLDKIPAKSKEKAWAIAIR